MSDHISMGNVIRLLRTDNNLSQEQLANLINVTRPVITNIESGKRRPTEEQLFDLSNKLDFDLVNFEYNSKHYKTLEHYLLSYKLNKLLESHKYETIANIIETNPMFNELNYNNVLVEKLYYEALISSRLEANQDYVIKICNNFFNIDFNNIEKFKIKINMPEKYYGLIIILGANLYYQNNFKNSLSLHIKLLDFLEKNYFNNKLPSIEVSSFLKKYYIKCHLNISCCYFELKDYEKTLDFCDKAIYKSNQLNILNVLTRIIKQKIEVLCKLNKLSEAKETYLDYKSICKLTDSMKYFEKNTNFFENNYPELFG